MNPKSSEPTITLNVAYQRTHKHLILRHKMFNAMGLGDILRLAYDQGYAFDAAWEMALQEDKAHWFGRKVKELYSLVYQREGTIGPESVAKDYQSLAYYFGISRPKLMGESMYQWMVKNPGALATKSRTMKGNTSITMSEWSVDYLTERAKFEGWPLGYYVKKAVKFYMSGQLKLTMSQSRIKRTKMKTVSTKRITINAAKIYEVLKPEIETKTISFSFLLSRILEEYIHVELRHKRKRRRVRG